MHTKILSRWLDERQVIGHAARAAVLLRSVGAVLTGGKLSLTHLGRNLSGNALAKHQIKAMDRLLGNPHLSRERLGVYRALASTMLQGKERPVIAVDWSDVQSGRQWAMLKAALPVGGRALTVYERVFPYKRYNTQKAHNEFLRELRKVLPEHCRPIIVSDAGFRGPWFKAIESFGWDWLGRIRNRNKYFHAETGRWRLTDSLFPEATTKPRHLGKVTVSRHRNYDAQLYLVRARKIRGGRPPKRRRPKRNNEAAYRRGHQTPWLLATSLPHSFGSEGRVVELYAKRMQIEETFRDLKSHRWGFGLCYSHCHQPQRIQALLLIAALAALVIWLIGWAGRAQQLHRHLQANTERRREVLSTFFIGRQLLRRCQDWGPNLIDDALATLRSSILQTACP